ncbi:MAG TPA: hypothetical protein ENG70_03530 [Candidatus Cloacimonetes bacterium]|nr:hypothetical protein [Candidatus Cloacimonadota bacterium]HEX37915.1 hypothetical protein [Candidatus Cloacimonadota bacterium]
MKLKICFFLMLFLYLSIQLSAQRVLVPLNDDVYDFLERMQTKGLLKRYHDGIKPISRVDVRKYLKEIEANQQHDDLLEFEQKLLDEYSKEFSYEQKFKIQDKHEENFLEKFIELFGDEDDKDSDVKKEQWKAFKFPYNFYSGESIISFEPKFQAAYQINSSDTSTFAENYQRLTGGGYIYGYLGDKIGFSFYGVNNAVRGNEFYVLKIDSPQQGIGVQHKRGDNYYYEEVDAALSFSAKYADITIGRFSNYWGCGHTGSIVLSNKAPSYPQVMLSAKFSNWLRFVYFHGWLESNIRDDSTSYLIPAGEDEYFERELYKKKYVAAHRLEFSPSSRFTLGLSELLYYGERDPELVYFIPIILFWSAQRYANDQDNELIGIDYEWIPWNGIKTYGSLLIDEISLSKMFDKENSHNYIAYQLGLYFVDLVVNGLDLRSEYTHLNPWVYTHKFPINEVSSDDYWMGYWTGQNADNLYLGAEYRFNSKLKFSADYSLYRKGAQDSIKHQYEIPPVEKFLYGHQYTKQTIGLDVQYEMLPQLVAEFGYTFTDCNVNEENIHKAEQGEYVNPVYYRSDFTKSTISIVLSWRFN